MALAAPDRTVSSADGCMPPRQEIEPGHVPAQDTLKTMFNLRVENTVAGKDLPRIFLDP